MIAPCLDCQERHLKCHDSCELYIAWAEETRKVHRSGVGFWQGAWTKEKERRHNLWLNYAKRGKKKQ